MIVRLAACLMPLACIVICATPVPAQTSIDKVLTAWRARSDSTKSIHAEWTVEQIPATADADAPVDPEPIRNSYEIWIRGDTLRLLRTNRYFDIDGGPNGSKSWQTARHEETYTPDGGWRSVTASSLTNALPSAAINRPPQLFRPGLSSYGLFALWYRPDARWLQDWDPVDWEVTRDAKFRESAGDFTVVTNGGASEQFIVLYLDNKRGFLPVISKTGRFPGLNAPFVDYQLTRIEFASDETTPKRWITQRVIKGRAVSPITIHSLLSMTTDDAHTPSSISDVEFPPSAVVSDESLHITSGLAKAGNSQTPRPGNAPSRPWSLANWGALGFGLLLLSLLAKRAWSS